MLGFAESQVAKLIIVKLFSKNSNACDHDPQHYRQTDGQTTYTMTIRGKNVHRKASELAAQ